MTIDTYTTLQTALQNWFKGRSDTGFVSAIPDFIALCEAGLNRRLRVRQMEGRYTATITAGNQYLAAPSGMISFRRLIITSSAPARVLGYVTPDEMYALWPDSTATGTPVNYTVIGTEVQFGPTPDRNYTVEGDYYAQIPNLATNTTNWLLQTFPDIYLYGALLQAAPFIGNDSRIPVWQGFYTTAMTELEENDEKDRYAMSSLVIRTDTANP